MFRNSIHVLLAFIIAIAMSGCGLRRNTPVQKFCPPYLSQRGPIEVGAKPQSAGVVLEVGGIPGYENAKRSLFDQLAVGNTIKIDLFEATCMAARNSEIADLIEAERHAIRCQANECQSGDCQSSECQSCEGQPRDDQDRAIDTILQGEALEQRNQAAGEAAELFLGLVQVQLQKELIEESKTHLAELNETIQAAEEAGFAMADGKNELAEGNIRVMESESTLSSTEQKLMYQLNLLINLDSDHPVIIQPVHELNPTDVKIDVRHQADIAEKNRPGILALETVISNGSEVGIESMVRLLRQFNPRLGIQLPAAPIKKMIFRRQVNELLKRESAPDATTESRRSQVQQILDAKKKKARIDAAEAMLGLQRSLEKLAILNENIARLEAKSEQLNGKNEIDARNAFLEQNQNWVELQQAKSDRIAAAIEHETAKVKLLQSQGGLSSQCGYDFHLRSETPKYWYCQ